MTCLPKKPCKLQSPSTLYECLHKARDVCHWVGHFNDNPSPADEFDDWLMTANSGAPQSQGSGGGGGGNRGGGSQMYPFVDVFLYMVLKARKAAAAMAVIMLSAIVIVHRSAQFIYGRWSQTFGPNCTMSGVHMFCFQMIVLSTLNMFILFTIYWPAYHAFISITGVVAWVVTALKAAVLSIFVIFP